MKLVKCSNQHFYDADKNETCPYCINSTSGMANRNDAFNTVSNEYVRVKVDDEYDKTELLFGHKPSDNLSRNDISILDHAEQENHIDKENSVYVGNTSKNKPIWYIIACLSVCLIVMIVVIVVLLSKMGSGDDTDEYKNEVNVTKESVPNDESYASTSSSINKENSENETSQEEIEKITTDNIDSSEKTELKIEENDTVLIDNGIMAVIKSTRQNVKIRARAVDGSAVTSANAGDEFEILAKEHGSDGFDWYNVKGIIDGNEVSGYVRADMVNIISRNGVAVEETVVAILKSGKNNINVRSKPVDGDSIAYLSSGEKYEILLGVKGTDGYVWYEIFGVCGGNVFRGYVREDMVDVDMEGIAVQNNVNTSTLSIIQPPDNKSFSKLGFKETTVRMNGTEANAWVLDNQIYMLYATTPSGYTGWVVYDSQEGRWIRYDGFLVNDNYSWSSADTWENVASTENNTIDLLDLPKDSFDVYLTPSFFPEGFYLTTIKIGSDYSEVWTDGYYYIIYAQSPTGRKGWFLFDSNEGRWIRYMLQP